MTISKKQFISFGLLGLLLLMGLSAGIQYIAGRKSASGTAVKPATTQVIAVDNRGVPTKQALITTINYQAVANGYPQFKADPAKITSIETARPDWYIVGLTLATADSSNTTALVHFNRPTSLELKAGPANYFYAKWLSRDNVPSDVITKLLTKNEKLDPNE